MLAHNSHRQEGQGILDNKAYKEVDKQHEKTDFEVYRKEKQSEFR